MNAEETGRLVALIASVCPQQPLIAPNEDIGEPGTAAYWWPLLQDVRYRDATLAAQRLARRKPFISVSEIVVEVAAIRSERLDAMPQNKRPLPNVDPADSQRYARAVRVIEKAIADGEIRSDGDGGYVLESARWQHAITAGPGAQAVEREVDYSQVFSEQRAALRAHRQAEGEAEHAARAVEAAERQRQLDALAHMIEGYEKTRAGKLARKRRLGKTITKPLAAVTDDGATMGPRAERDAAAS